MAAISQKPLSEEKVVIDRYLEVIFPRDFAQFSYRFSLKSYASPRKFELFRILKVILFLQEEFSIIKKFSWVRCL